LINGGGVRVRDRDGDPWRVRVRLLPILPPLPAFRGKSKNIARLSPPPGVGEAYYRLAMRGDVFFWLLIAWPLVVLGQLAANAITTTASLVRRMFGRETWIVVASPRGHERARSLHWAVTGFGDARHCSRAVARALAEGKGLYEIEGANLLDAPLFERAQRD
jgi:hypothetical protein